MFLIQLLAVLAIVFIGMVVVLRQILARHITTVTSHLQGLSHDYLKKQEELKARLEEAERHYQEQLANAQEEAQQLKAQALQEAETARQRLLEQARQEAEQIVQQALRAREAIQQELVQSLETRAVERACELIREILPHQLREAVHRQWLDELVHNGFLTIKRLEIREDVREAQVVSAFPLTPSQRTLLAERLQSALGVVVSLQDTVDPRIIAGLIVTVGHVVVDGSLSSRLQEAARHARKE